MVGKRPGNWKSRPDGLPLAVGRTYYGFMLRPLAFANAIAVTTLVLALFLLALRVASPSAFTFFFNAQFFGADVRSLLPSDPPLWKVAAELVALLAGAWGIGYLWAILYNRWAK